MRLLYLIVLAVLPGCLEKWFPCRPAQPAGVEIETADFDPSVPLIIPMAGGGPIAPRGSLAGGAAVTVPAFGAGAAGGALIDRDDTAADTFLPQATIASPAIP